jgi:cobalt/nickel transport protein
MEAAMNRFLFAVLPVFLVWVLVTPSPVRAHFGTLIPDDDIVSQGESRSVRLQAMFMHPMEGSYMQMDRPASFGLLSRGKRVDLLPHAVERKVAEFSTWEVRYSITRPGDHIFYVEPVPYWEPAEGCFIVHYTKVVVGAFGLEDSWEKEIGLKTEIVPLTRPYGLWAGNVFTGIVKVSGRPVPFVEVEVEYLNTDGVSPPADPYITQVVRTDGNGIFTYAMPRAGWWGFAALTEDDRKISRDGKEYPVEIGAVIWVRTREMK